MLLGKMNSLGFSLKDEMDRFIELFNKKNYMLDPVQKAAIAHLILFDDFFGKLTSGKWAKIAKCSNYTVLNDVNDLVSKCVLKKNDKGGQSTNDTIVIS